ncbi:MAG: hypothetical protein JXE06_02735 [Coriobacteriia bacterium]|nr:hypothetical protein [Coriobacteriia bacterium]MBN2822802.1 hypothetical protein [Coriobacteriia bacterium]
MGLFRKNKRADSGKIRAMLIMVVHPDSTFIEPPSNVKEFCTNVATDNLVGIEMDAGAAAGVIPVPYSGTLDDAVALAQRDLPDVMNDFLAQQGVSAAGLDMQYGVDELNPTIKLVYTAAVG